MPNNDPKRILIRGVNWLGDAIMTTPALMRLRERFPDAHIALLSPSKIARLFEHHPAINDVIAIEGKRRPWSVGRQLKRENFDLAVVFPNSPRSAMETWFARIPRRVGYLRKWRKWFLTECIEPRPGEFTMVKKSDDEIRALVENPPKQHPKIPESAHHIHQYLHLAGVVGANTEPMAPSLSVRDGEVEKVCAKFGATPPGKRDWPLFGLNAGAEYGPAKRWPRDRFVRAAVDLVVRTHCDWWIFGGTGDRELAEGIAREIRHSAGSLAGNIVSLAGKTSLRELCAALKNVDLLLTNDTGPMHVAAAVGTPVIVPFGSTSPELTGPGLPGDHHHVRLQKLAPCAPCFRRICPIDFRCMTDISVYELVNAVEKTWQRIEGDPYLRPAGD